MKLLRRIAFELALTVAGVPVLVWAAAAFAVLQLREKPAKVGFTLAAVGEREHPDGSWEGADLLRDASPAIDRFQLTLTPDDEVRLLVEAQSPGGSWERLYLGTLRPHRDYALPAPDSFFRIQGDARVRLTVSRLVRQETPAPAQAGEIQQGPPLPLTDRTPFHAGRVHFAGDRAATLGLSLHGR